MSHKKGPIPNGMGPGISQCAFCLVPHGYSRENKPAATAMQAHDQNYHTVRKITTNPNS